MKVGTKEFYDIMDTFERQYEKEYNTTRETKDLWKCGIYYCNGDTDTLFKGFLSGYSLAKCRYYQLGGYDEESKGVNKND